MTTTPKFPITHAPGAVGRPGYKLKSDGTLWLDIRRWNREGLMGTTFTVQWPDSDACINVAIADDTVRLTYFAMKENGDWHDASQNITITTNPCHLGGRRLWFTCPACPRRAAVLYLRDGRFACRHCQCISYASQSQTAEDRFFNRYHRLKEIALPPKPLWQRWATRNRILDRYCEANATFDKLLDLHGGML